MFCLHSGLVYTEKVVRKTCFLFLNFYLHLFLLRHAHPAHPLCYKSLMSEWCITASLYKHQLSSRKVWIIPIIEQGWLTPGFAQGFPFTSEQQQQQPPPMTWSPVFTVCWGVIQAAASHTGRLTGDSFLYSCLVQRGRRQIRHWVVLVMLPSRAKNKLLDTWLCFHFTLSRLNSQQ